MNLILDDKQYNKIMDLAEKLLKLKIADESLKTKEIIFAAIVTAIDLKVSIMYFIKNVLFIPKDKKDSDKINIGKFHLSITMLLALAHKSGKIEYIKEKVFLNSDGEIESTCEMKRKGMTAAVINTYCEKDARNAGLIKSNEKLEILKRQDPEKLRKELSKPWYRFRARMVLLKARGYCLRDTFGDTLLGIEHSTEELTDTISNDSHEQLFSEYIDQEVELNNKPFSEENLLIPLNHLKEVLVSKIDSIKSNEDHEMYKLWSQNNKKLFSAFFDKDVMADIGKIYQAKKDQLSNIQNVENKIIGI